MRLDKFGLGFKVALFVAVLLGSFSVVGGFKDTFAASASYPNCCPQGAPNPATHIVTSRQGNGVNLDAPNAYLEAKFSADATHFLFAGSNLGWQAGNPDSGTVRPASCVPNDVVIRVYGSNSTGGINLSSYHEWDPATINGGADCRNIQTFRFRLPTGGGTNRVINAPETEDGYRHIYFRVYLRDTAGGGNKFKLRAEGFRSASYSAASGNSQTVLGYSASDIVGGGPPLPFSLVHAPLTSVGTSNYSLKFAVPCDISSRTFDLIWTDADRGPTGVPVDNGIDWRLVNETTGRTQSRTVPLGGQAALGLQRITSTGSFTVTPGHNYRWEWTNVANNNGIQFVMPFSETSYRTTFCHDYKAGITSSIAVPAGVTRPVNGATIYPGQLVQIRARPRNTDGVSAGPPFNFRIRPQPATDTASKIRLTWFSNQGPNTLSNSNGSPVPGTGSYLAINEDSIYWGTLGTTVDPTPGGIGGMAARSYGDFREYRFQVNSDASPGPVCFQAGVSNYIGRRGPTEWRNSPDPERICFNIAGTSSGTEYNIEDPRAAFNDLTKDPVTNCYTASAGAIVTFSAGVTNTGDGDARSVNGPVLDVLMNESVPSSQGRVLTRTAGNNRYDDQALGGNGDSYVTPNIQYRIPADANVGEVFQVGAYFVNAETVPNPFGAANQVSFNGTTNAPGIDSPGPQFANACLEVTDFAYLKAHGAGVWSGAVWASYDTCRNGVPSFNSDDYGDDFSRISSQISQGRAPDGLGIGSSTEFAATSTKDTITGFASGTAPNRNIGAGTSLSFANTTTPPGTFLGDADSPMLCLPDLHQHIVNTAGGSINTLDISALNGIDGTEYAGSRTGLFRATPAPGDFTTGTLNFQHNVVVLVDGDLNLRGNITYSSNYGTGSAPTIPSIVVIVKGDINIASNVTQLDGLYISIPNDINNPNGGGGSVDTCSDFATDNLACDNSQLLVNGAIVSNDISFRRFTRSIGDASRDLAASLISSQDAYASEIFTLRPELYISNPFAQIGSNTSNRSFSDRYDYFRERAPVY